MQKVSSFGILFALLCATSWASEPERGHGPKTSPELNRLDPGATVDVIVQYRVRPTDAHFDRVHRLGGTDKRRFTQLPGAAFTLPASAIEELANDPDVSYISVDRKVHSHLDLSAATIGAPATWSAGYTGAGIGVAIVDSGIDQTIQDLGNSNGQTDPNHTRVVFAENFLVPATNPGGNPNPQRYRTQDGYGHGTHVAGIVAGNGFLSSGPNAITTFKGVAPQANLIDFQVLDANGEGQDSTVIAALEEAINLKSKYNIRVINLSLGRPVYESFAQDPLCQAVEQAWAAGIVVVVAAGNDGRDNSFGNNGYGTIDAPANDPYVITVGAMNAELTPFRGDDVITTYSSKGPTMVDHIVKPDIVAPGNHISSLLSNNTYLAKTYPQDVVNALVYQNHPGPSNYLILNGTSMAAGVVSGAAADLLNANPSLPPDQVKAILMLSSSKQYRTYTGAYYNLASLSYGQNAQLQQAQQQLQQAQAQLGPLTNQAQQAQQKATQAASQAQTTTTNYNNAVQQANSATTALATAQANYNAASAAYTAVVGQPPPASGPGPLPPPAPGPPPPPGPPNLAAIQAQIALNQAQNALNQAQNAVNQANNQVQNTLQQMNQANSASASAAAAAANAQAAEEAAAQNVATLQALVFSLEIPAANLQAQLQGMQNDPTQYTDTQYDIFTVGAGYLDLNAAIANRYVAPLNTVALSPVAFLDADGSTIDVTGNYAAACGNLIPADPNGGPLAGTPLCSVPGLMNATAIWSAPSDVQGANGVWGANSVWGANTISADRSVWVRNTVWGANSVWGASAVSGDRSVWIKDTLSSDSATSAFNSVWGASSVWGANATGDDAATSVLTNGDQ